MGFIGPCGLAFGLLKLNLRKGIGTLMMTYLRRRCQGMTEYIVVVGLVAILLVTAVSNFGFSVDEASQGTSLALVTRLDPPPSGTPEGAFHPKSFQTDKNKTVKLRNVNGSWQPYVGADPYDRGDHGTMIVD